VKVSGAEFGNAPDWARKDREIATAAVCPYGYALRHVHHTLLDKSMVLAAVSNCGDILEMVSEEYGDDREIVDAAITAPHGGAIAYASKRLRSDPDMVRKALLSDGRVVGMCKVHNNSALVSLCIRNCTRYPACALLMAAPE
jgi:hypothetical protein